MGAVISRNTPNTLQCVSLLMCNAALWHQQLIKLLQGASPGLESAVVAHMGKEGILLHEVVSPTLVFTGWMCLCVALLAAFSVPLKNNPRSLVFFPCHMVPSLLWGCLIPSLHPKGLQAPLGSLAEAAGCGRGVCCGLPCSHSYLFTKVSSLNTASAKQADPRGTSCKRLKGGPVTIFLHGCCMNFNFSLGGKKALKTENKKSDFFPQVFLPKPCHQLVQLDGPHPISSSDSGASPSLFWRTCSAECPEFPC